MCLFPLLARNNKAPVKAEISEPNNTASFDSLIKRELSKERLVMKIDIVNPIPATNPTDSNCKILTSSGIFPIFSLSARNENSVIPAALPMKSPSIIPRLSDELNSFIAAESMSIAVFTRAKIGSIK